MRKFCLAILSTLLLLPICHATVPVGQWDTHFSYGSVSSVAATENKVFAVSNQRLFCVTAEDNSVDIFSTLDGLSSDLVQLIGYDNSGKRLLICYSNGDLDIIDRDGDIYNIPDIKDSQIANEKTVLQIYFENGHAFLACNFGIVNVNLSRLEITDTYIIGNNYSQAAVYGFTGDGEYYYAIADGVCKRIAANGTNMLDYRNWETMPGTLPSSSVSGLYNWNGNLVMAVNGSGCFRYVNNDWQQFTYDSGNVGINIQGNNLLVSNSSNVRQFTSFEAEPASYPVATQCAVIKNGDVWGGTGSGLMKYSSDGTGNLFLPNGPATNYGQFSYTINDKIYVCPGMISGDRGMYPPVLQIYDGSRWTNIEAAASGAAALAPNGWTNDWTSVAVDPNDENHIFVSSWGEGVFEFQDGVAVKLHNYESTGGVLHYALAYDNGHVVRATGLCYDEDGLLWITNSFQAEPLKYMTADGVWHSAACARDFTDYARITQLLIGRDGKKWINSLSLTAGVIVIEDNGTYDDASDDNCRIFSSFTDQNGNVITPTRCNQIAEDRNGAIWVATTSGPIIFNNVSRVFNSNYNCSRVLIPRNDGSGLADFLLDEVNVKCIAVDGANRKWLGTQTAGLYLVSADGQTQLEHFTAENSPLGSNDIESLAIDPETGELLIVCNGGIYSYMAEATEPVDEFSKDGPYVFPNPVRPEYTGMITIRGLEENTLVRITDSAGNLVFEGMSTGGSLVWNGKNFHGSNVAAGIYYAHCSNSSSDNNRSTAAKFLIIR